MTEQFPINPTSFNAFGSTFKPKKYIGRIHRSLAEAYQANRDAQNRYNSKNRDHVKAREHAYYIEVLKPRRKALQQEK